MFVILRACETAKQQAIVLAVLSVCLSVCSHNN